MDLVTQSLYREAKRVYKRVSRRTSVVYGGTHATKPNKSPKYDRKRVIDSAAAYAKADVDDAKAGIDHITGAASRKKRRK